MGVRDHRATYTANKLNQYTAEGTFRPTFDADGNQTLIKTGTGTWNVTYNAKNRPIIFTKSDGSVTVECTYKAPEGLEGDWTNTQCLPRRGECPMRWARINTMGRRATKKVTTNGTLTEHRRFLYRGYLQIDSPPPHRRLTPAGQSRFTHCPTGLTAVVRLACCDLTRAYTPALWFITWESPRRLGGGLDKHEVFAPKGRKHPTAVRVIRQCRRHCPRQGASCREAAASQRRNGVPASQPTQPTATRPLAIQKNGTWYTYGWDLTKNICETYRTDARIDLAYTYPPYGEVSPAHTYDQPLRWSSEYHDTELGLHYYNYRHYNPAMGRWMSRDFIISAFPNSYHFLKNRLYHIDIIGLTEYSSFNWLADWYDDEGGIGYGASSNDINFARIDFRLKFSCTCNDIIYLHTPVNEEDGMKILTSTLYLRTVNYNGTFHLQASNYNPETKSKDFRLSSHVAMTSSLRGNMTFVAGTFVLSGITVLFGASEAIAFSINIGSDVSGIFSGGYLERSSEASKIINIHVSCPDIQKSKPEISYNVDKSSTAGARPSITFNSRKTSELYLVSNIL